MIQIYKINPVLIYYHLATFKVTKYQFRDILLKLTRHNVRLLQPNIYKQRMIVLAGALV